jgi:hypothetical protein
VKVKSTSGRLVHFAGNTVRIDSDLPEIASVVGAHLKHCSGENGPIIANYKITTVNNTDYKVSVDGSDLSSGLNYDQTLWILMQDVITRLNGISTTDLVFHAAALALDNRGIIICGQSGCGKSSIAAWLTANGFQYLTDEVISLPRNSDEIRGLCRSIVLKHGSAFIWQRWLSKKDADDFLHFNDDSAWIEPALFYKDAARASVKPWVLIFPRFVPEAEFLAKRLTPANALFRLLQCLVNARNFPDHGMSATTRLARQVTSYSLVYSNIESAAKWINQITLAG